ncbi:uncharacterized protein LOC62_01G001745 [Vanrija pseudolonga]|uniref:Uncharacterized protein n=1 Tax=Vanrija pseudolonga TaxID=143232 RepID=A0AAF1BHZ7_9TREE|nr:hypothetical protein LOC62_01G001745 [Vanrija pseudolonga]
MKIIAICTLLLVPTLLAAPAPAAQPGIESLLDPETLAGLDLSFLDESLPRHLDKKDCTYQINLIITKARAYYGPFQPVYMFGETVYERCGDTGCSGAVRQYQNTPLVWNTTLSASGITTRAVWVAHASVITAIFTALQNQTNFNSGCNYWTAPQAVGTIASSVCGGQFNYLSVMAFQSNALSVGDGGWCDPNNLSNLINNAKSNSDMFKSYQVVPLNQLVCSAS